MVTAFVGTSHQVQLIERVSFKSLEQVLGTKTANYSLRGVIACVTTSGTELLRTQPEPK